MAFLTVAVMTAPGMVTPQTGTPYEQLKWPVTEQQYKDSLPADVDKESGSRLPFVDRGELDEEGGGLAQLTLQAESMAAAPDHAVALGMIVNELVTNALKYAYPDEKGAIRVILKRDGDNRRPALEKGGPGPRVP